MEIDYKKVCFVVMPFGIKKVGDRTINFDTIYDRVFMPAIEGIGLPEGGTLIPKRTDRDFFSALIDTDMFLYLEYSRIILADITGLNPNVMYELGVRHRAHQSGTAIFRQNDVSLPFDINHIKAFPYQYEPEEHIEQSIAVIKEVITNSLLYNRLDSPVQAALATQQRFDNRINELLREASNAIRNRDLPKAIGLYDSAIAIQPANPTLYLEQGLLLKDRGDWPAAIEAFRKATELSATYAEAFRELGIAENKAFCKAGPETTVLSGEQSLQKAIAMNNQDFDAYASLGGIYKRQKRFDESLAMYNQAVDVSNGHPYPLLNALILQVMQKGMASISPKQFFLLNRAEIQLQKQVLDEPPYNAPWSFFDLSMIAFFKGNHDVFIQLLEKGVIYADLWNINTHLDTLQLLSHRKDLSPSLESTIAYLQQCKDFLSASQ